ncbi:hypothetical protein [Dechloromonas sp. CZR5]|uniref:hypothetical protein n=1 Tax=Dechloromonas sp. CZR5 TaxID=2608630 RepID=UPI00123CE076|nr:hypothetical protein [Dechloromonas sp. CZR5]
MPKSLPTPTPTLNRLRAAAGLVPIIETGLVDGKLTQERAALMASFCEWAIQETIHNEDESLLAESIHQGLDRIKLQLSKHT